MRVPYPHVERSVVVVRPALVVASASMVRDRMLLWTIMITNAERESWPGDIAIPKAETLGLLIPSKIRMAKISTVEAESASLIGRISPDLLREVQASLRATFAL